MKEKPENVPIFSLPDVFMAVQRARSAQPMWENLGFKKRGWLMMELRRIILRRMDEIAELISKENGKPVIEAISHDIMPTLDLITYFAKKSAKLLME